MSPPGRPKGEYRSAKREGTPVRLFAADALTPHGWLRDVAVDIDADGMIVRVEPNAQRDGAERVAGPLLPGVPNLHSHAFQRALAGRTGHANADGDSFWTWRRAMYAFLDRIDADAFEAIAAQAYVEMLKAGYTAVAEFHYVHHDPRGKPYADPTELAHRITAAADATGIALTLLPVFYAHADFGGMPPTEGQRRFVHTVDSFAPVVASLSRDAAVSGWRLGIAPHSLRAVTPDELRAIVALVPRGAPIHIHAAEQQNEVAACVTWSGARPVEWLLEHAGIDTQWCIVHATHMTSGETRSLAATGAVVGLCPTTEADLGDGVFRAVDYLAAGGHLGIGGDSHVGVDPFLELRLVDVVQRVTLERRNVLARDGESSGLTLYQTALAGGARALAQPVGAIAAGRRADLLVLNGDDPGLVEQAASTMLDAAIYGPGRRIVRDVMVAGRWVIGEGHHADEEAVLLRYRQALKRLLA